LRVLKNLDKLLTTLHVRGVTAVTNETASTSVSLLLRVRNLGDDTAWREFHSVYAPLIASYCRRRGVRYADAADISQNTIVRVTKAIQTFEYRPEKGRFRDWLGTITRHEILRHARRESREPLAMEFVEQLDTFTEEREWSEAFVAHVVQVARDNIRHEFEASTWHAFEATWFGTEPTQEVADRLGLSVMAVYVAKSRVASRLLAEIVRLAEDFPT
jgi:RNA polymerase sigma-70 factor, ECF subfamily